MPKYFPKGVSPNPGGKPKDGSPRAPMGSKKKQRLKVAEILESMDFRPFEEMVKLFRETKKERVKVDILIDLCSYIAPKLKNVEITGDQENPFIINLNVAPGRKNIEFSPVVDEIIGDDDDEKR